MRIIITVMFLILGITFGIEKFALVYITGITQNKTTLISQNGFDLDHGINFSENRLELVVSRSEFHTLDNLEIEYSIQHEDLEAFYASRLTTDSSRDFENGTMGGYYTFSEVEQNLDELTA